MTSTFLLAAALAPLQLAAQPAQAQAGQVRGSAETVGPLALETLPTPVAEDRSASTSERVTTYVHPRFQRLWAGMAAGGSLRIAPETRAAAEIEVRLTAPFLVWRGAFEPVIVPHMRLAYTGLDRTSAAAGTGLGTSEPWLKARWSYLPSAVIGVTGARSAEVGFSHHIVAREAHWLHAAVGHTYFVASREHAVMLVVGVTLFGGER